MIFVLTYAECRIRCVEIRSLNISLNDSNGNLINFYSDSYVRKGSYATSKVKVYTWLDYGPVRDKTVLIIDVFYFYRSKKISISILKSVVETDFVENNKEISVTV